MQELIIEMVEQRSVHYTKSANAMTNRGVEKLEDHSRTDFMTGKCTLCHKKPISCGKCNASAILADWVEVFE